MPSPDSTFEHIEELLDAPDPNSSAQLATLLERELSIPDGLRRFARHLAAVPNGESFVGRLGAAAGGFLPAGQLDALEAARVSEVERRTSVIDALRSNIDSIVADIQMDGTIGFCNAAATRATGLRSGDSLISFAAAFDVAQLVRVQQELAEGTDRVHFSAPLDIDGADHPFDFTMSKNVVAGELVSFSLIGYDVSALRGAEEAADQAQAFLRAVLNASPDGVLATDEGGRIVFMNPAAEAIFHDDDPDLPWNIEAIDGAPPLRSSYPLLRAIAGEEGVHAVVQTRVDGGTRIMDAVAEPIIGAEGTTRGAVAITRDVTAAIEATTAAVEQHALLDSVFSSTSEAIVAVDRDGLVLYINPIAASLFGLLSQGVAIDSGAADIRSVDGQPPSAETLPLERALRGERDVHAELVIEGNGPGGDLHVSGISNPILDPDGLVLGAVGVYRDITEAKAAAVTEEARRAFTLAMLSAIEQPVLAVNVLTDEAYLNSAADALGFPDPSSEAPFPLVHADGSPINPDLLYDTMVGGQVDQVEMHHAETGRVFLTSTHSIENTEGVLGAVMTASDITELRGAFQQLELQSAAMEATITAMFITDVDGTIEWVNRAFSEISGFSASEAVGKNPRILKSGHQGPAHYRELWETILAGRPWSGRVINRKKDGSDYVVEQWVTPIADASGDITHFIAIHEDITAQVAAEGQILHMATHDALTDLANRRLFLEHLEKAIARSERSGRPLTVLMLDLDKFKDVNDSLGHQAGDELLVEVAARLGARMREADVVARLGGDEFAVIVEEADLEAAEQVAHAIVEELARPYEIHGSTVRCGTSIGLAILEEGLDGEQLMDRADMALYAAKEVERGTLQVFRATMGDASRRQAELATELSAALDSNDLRLEYQLVFDVATGMPTSIEALPRWDHPDGTILLPDSFVGAAADQGMLPRLGAWVLDSVCAQLREWIDTGLDMPPVSINVSGQELRTPRWATSLQLVAESYDLPLSALAVELTEDGIMAAAQQNLAALRGMRGEGLHITLDDFGTGYSSLLRFKSLPIDRIKLAKVFVADLLTDFTSGPILKAAALLADSVSAKLVAKGVETEVQLREVMHLGCTEVQGWVAEYPMPAHALAPHLGRRHVVFDRVNRPAGA